MSSVFNWVRFLYKYLLWNVAGAIVRNKGKAYNTTVVGGPAIWSRFGWTDLLFDVTGWAAGYLTVNANTTTVCSSSSGFDKDIVSAYLSVEVEVKPSNVDTAGQIIVKFEGENLLYQWVEIEDTVVVAIGTGDASVYDSESIDFSSYQLIRVKSVQNISGTNCDVGVTCPDFVHEYQG